MIKKIILLSLSFILTACATQEYYKTAPKGADLTGLWVFESQDEHTRQHLINALNFVPLRLERFNSQQSIRNAEREDNKTGKILRDLMVGQLSITPKELYIVQKSKTIAIDFGVAGYHTFNIGDKTEILMEGFEVDAFAGWKKGQFILRLNAGDSYKLFQKLTRSNKKQLIETIELVTPGRTKPVKHNRYYRLSETN